MLHKFCKACSRHPSRRICYTNRIWRSTLHHVISQFYSRKASIGGTELPASLTAYNTTSPKSLFHQLSAFQFAFITTSNHFGLSHRLHSRTAIFISIIYVRRTVDSLFRHSSNLSKKEDTLVLFNEVALARLFASGFRKESSGNLFKKPESQSFPADLFFSQFDGKNLFTFIAN